MFDTAIIGSGVAGLSAALTLKALRRDIIWFGRRDLSEKIAKAEKIRNYPGLAQISGADMQKAFLDQMEREGLAVTEKQVTGVYHLGTHFGVLCGQETFEARTVILTTGVEAVKPLPGELEFIGRGVSYCATCDGFLYKDKTIAVLCTVKGLEHEVEYLASLAKKVYLCARYPDPAISLPNVETVTGRPLAVEGGARAERMVFDDRTVGVDGVFMLKAAVTPAVLVPGLESEGGHIAVDRQMRTNLPGCFAAGDCTGRPYQYAKAAGEGNVAAHAANAFLAENKVESL